MTDATPAPDGRCVGLRALGRAVTLACALGVLTSPDARACSTKRRAPKGQAVTKTSKPPKSKMPATATVPTSAPAPLPRPVLPPPSTPLPGTKEVVQATPRAPGPGVPRSPGDSKGAQQIQPVPEPTTALIVLCGCGGVVLGRRWRSRRTR